MSDPNARKQKQKEDINVALGSPYQFAPAGSQEDEHTPELAARESHERRCQVLCDGSQNDPPWICVAKCDDEDPLPIPETELTIYDKIKGTSDWKCDDGRGDIITVIFWRDELPEGRKGKGKEVKWNYLWVNRQRYANQPPAPGHEEPPAQGGGQFEDFFDLSEPRISRFNNSNP